MTSCGSHGLKRRSRMINDFTLNILYSLWKQYKLMDVYIAIFTLVSGSPRVHFPLVFPSLNNIINIFSHSKGNGGAPRFGTLRQDTHVSRYCPNWGFQPWGAFKCSKCIIMVFWAQDRQMWATKLKCFIFWRLSACSMLCFKFAEGSESLQFQAI